jgi:hypothetical protein
MTSVRTTLAQRRREGDWTEEEIMLLADPGPFTVDRYSPNHEPLRKLATRLMNEGQLVMTGARGRFYYYRKSPWI